MNEEKAYLIILENLTEKSWCVSSGINNPPLNRLNIWIDFHNPPNVRTKCVIMDQGGKIARNPAIVSLFDKYG